MIYFYVLLFIGFALLVAAVCLTIAGNASWGTLRAMVGVIFAASITIIVASFMGMADFRGYAYFDPEVCAQMVYVERHWNCVTWEEVG